VANADSFQGDVHIRDVEDGDLVVLFEQQLDLEATRMAAFPARARDPFMAHWARIRADPSVGTQTIVGDDQVVGNIVSWDNSGKREVGYWLGRRHWGRGIATRALALFVAREKSRPLYAHVAAHNAGSIRVLEKCGFRRLTAQEFQSATAVADDVEEVMLVLEN